MQSLRRRNSVHCIWIISIWWKCNWRITYPINRATDCPQVTKGSESVCDISCSLHVHHDKNQSVACHDTLDSIWGLLPNQTALCLCPLPISATRGQHWDHLQPRVLQAVDVKGWAKLPLGWRIHFCLWWPAILSHYTLLYHFRYIPVSEKP